MRIIEADIIGRLAIIKQLYAVYSKSFPALQPISYEGTWQIKRQAFVPFETSYKITNIVTPIDIADEQMQEVSEDNFYLQITKLAPALDWQKDFSVLKSYNLYTASSYSYKAVCLQKAVEITREEYVAVLRDGIEDPEAFSNMLAKLPDSHYYSDGKDLVARVNILSGYIYNDYLPIETEDCSYQFEFMNDVLSRYLDYNICYVVPDVSEHWNALLMQSGFDMRDKWYLYEKKN